MFGWTLVPDIADWHKWWSVRFAALGAVTTVASVVFPGVLGFVNPFERPGTYAAVSTAFLLVTLVSRLVDQPSLDK